jgi:hypothetical protein
VKAAAVKPTATTVKTASAVRERRRGHGQQKGRYRNDDQAEPFHGQSSFR